MLHWIPSIERDEDDPQGCAECGISRVRGVNQQCPECRAWVCMEHYDNHVDNCTEARRTLDPDEMVREMKEAVGL